MSKLTLVLCFLFVGSIGAANFRDLAKRIKVGTSLNQAWLKDPPIEKMTGELFNMLSPEDEMKWEVTEPENGKFNYGPADAVVDYAEKHNMTFRGHNLIWYQQIPKWLDSLNKTELHKVMVRRIKDIVTRYKGRLYAWDVVNEPTVAHALRPTIWYNNFGESYISESFHIARQADPKVKLYINEYSIESNSTRARTLYSWVKKFKSEGVPIDGVGFQCHFTTGQVPKELESMLRWFAGLGVEVAITEMDIALQDPNNKTELAQQAKDFASVYRACQNVKECVSTTTWSFTDKYSWHGKRHPCLYDDKFNARPAVAAVEEVLRKG